MMAKKPSREKRVTQFSIRWTGVLVLLAILGGLLVGLGQSTQQVWLQAVGAVLVSGYAVGFLAFVLRYQQVLDDLVRQRNLEAAAIGLVLLVFSSLVYLLCDLFGLNLPQPTVSFLLTYAMTLYGLSYVVLWWRSR